MTVKENMTHTRSREFTDLTAYRNMNKKPSRLITLTYCVTINAPLMLTGMFPFGYLKTKRIGNKEKKHS